MRGKRVYINLFVAVSLLLLVTSCEKGERLDGRVKIEFNSSYVQQSEASTRAILSGYSSMSGTDAVVNMGVFVSGVNNESTVTYQNGGWNSSLKLEPADYKIYSYLPKMSGVTFVYTDALTKITLPHLPFIGDKDILISSGAYRSTTMVTDVKPYLTKNLFDITVRGGVSNYVSFMMDRVLAKVNLNFSVSEKYNDIRTIEIVRVYIDPVTELNGTFNIECSIAEQAMTYAITPTGGTYPASTLVCNYQGELSSITESQGGAKALPVTPNQNSLFAPLYVVPGAQNRLKLRVVYNVYDKSGQLTRANQEVANNSISLLQSGVLQRAREYNLNIQIVPTYLYTLSDNDLESIMIVQ